MKKNILYGVCGIGNGHTYRQLPIIEYFAKKNTVVIFAYDSSYDFYTKYFSGNKNISILNVAVPFYVGNRDGIDFEATKRLEKNNKDFDGINNLAKTKTREIIGRPDLVISDYEPICAQYAYEYKAPLITIDQQSKYLVGKFPEELHSQTYADEVERLKMFFPKARARIACSFFDVEKENNEFKVLMYPPIIKESIIKIKRKISSPISILVYFSSQIEFPQSLKEISVACVTQPQSNFHVFAPNIDNGKTRGNVFFYKHHDKAFNKILGKCSGIISTAGHTLLSEAMYLNIPVYALPLAVYEQQMNAEIIERNGFGMRAENVNEEKLQYFISNIGQFRTKIINDKTVLLRGNGKEKIIKYLEEVLKEENNA
jgi:uncharacterized protein (TIGR00661 family)